MTLLQEIAREISGRYLPAPLAVINAGAVWLIAVVLVLVVCHICGGAL